MQHSESNDLAIVWRILSACRRHVLIVAAFTSIVVAGAVMVTSLLPPVYTAFSMVWLGQRGSLMIASDSAWDTVNSRSSARFNRDQAATMQATLTSIPVLRRVVLALDLDRDPDQLRSQLDIFTERLTARLGLTSANSESAADTPDRQAKLALVSDAQPPSMGTLSDLGGGPASIAALAVSDPRMGGQGHAAGEKEMAIRAAVAMLAEELVVMVNARSEIAIIEYSSTNAELAAKIVNALPEAYAAEREARLRADNENAVSWLSTRVEALRQDVVDAEAAVEQFRVENGLSSQDSEARPTTQLENYRSRLAAAQAGAIEAETRLERANATVESSSVDLELFRSPAMERLVDVQLSEIGRRRELLSQVGPSHGAVAAIDRKLEGIERDIALEKRRLVAEMAAEVDRAEQLVTTAQERLAAEQENLSVDLGTSTAVVTRLNQLTRNHEAATSLYRTMVTRLNDAQQVAQLDPEAVSLIQAALVPSAPSGFSPKILIAAAGFGSMFLGFGLVAGIALLDRRILHYDQVAGLGVERIVNAPAVDEKHVSPSAGGRLKNGSRQAFRARLLYDEALRRVLTQTLYDGSEQKRVLLVTSGSKQEGKSTVSRSLALCAAASGTSTVLVEADLRSPGGYTPKLGGSNGGLCDFLDPERRDVSLDDIIIKDRRTGLDVVPTSDTVQHSTELLASARMGSLINTLVDRYDFVVIDSPPACLTADPEILMQFADDLVFVLRYGSSTIDRAQRALSLLGRAATRRTIMFVNMTSMSFFDEYYGYGEHVYESTARPRSWLSALRRRMRRTVERST